MATLGLLWRGSVIPSTNILRRWHKGRQIRSTPLPGRGDTPLTAKVPLEVGANVRSTVLSLGLRLRWESTVWHIPSDFILRIQIGRYTH